MLWVFFDSMAQLPYS